MRQKSTDLASLDAVNTEPDDQRNSKQAVCSPKSKKENEIRSTATHVFFWYGPFSNWHRPSYFSGTAALEETLQQLDKAGVAYPPRSSAITTLLAGHRYLCGEQWMMAAKAWLFDDAYILARIQAEDHPKAHKALGRKVSGFDEHLWANACMPIVIGGSIARFAANPAIAKQLLGTGDRALVEGSPYDRLWGVGITWDDPKIEDEQNWRGHNLLGQALVAARTVLAERDAPRRRFSR